MSAPVLVSSRETSRILYIYMSGLNLAMVHVCKTRLYKIQLVPVSEN